MNNKYQCKWIEFANQKLQSGWMVKKIRPHCVLSTNDTPTLKTYIKSKRRDGKRYFMQMKADRKWGGGAILIADKIDLSQNDNERLIRSLHNNKRSKEDKTITIVTWHRSI